jgi:hypothetical protein
MYRLLIITVASLTLVGCTRKSGQPLTVDSVPDSVYIERGNQLVSLTFDTLRNSLLGAIGKHGFPYAISFCNEHAASLTAAFKENDATIRRTSLHYRSPLNEPDSLERSVLSQFEKEGPSTKIIRAEGEVHFIKPILMQAMCLNCHGKPGENILPETLEKIQANYPADKATGYSDGDLRGIWHIIFRK